MASLHSSILQMLKTKMDAALTKAEQAKAKALWEQQQENQLALQAKDFKLAMLHSQVNLHCNRAQQLEADLRTVVQHYVERRSQSKATAWISELDSSSIATVRYAGCDVAALA
jgi:hypothetical protein